MSGNAKYFRHVYKLDRAFYPFNKGMLGNILKDHKYTL